jgi:cytochrome c oxidase cbb3-type subunit 3
MLRNLFGIVGTVTIVLACIAASVAQPRGAEPQENSSGGKNQPADDSLRNIYPNLPPNQDPAAVQRGKRLFEANCAFCHGTDGRGGNGGPDLVRSVLVNHDETGALIIPVIREGRINKRMPAFSFSDTQVSDLVAFLHQRNRDARLRFTYEIPNVAVGDVAGGEAYFASHCSGCHSVTRDLAGIATKYPPDELQQHWLGPPPVPARVTVMLPSGQSYKGVLSHIDEFSVSLYDSQGNYRSFVLMPETHVQVTDPLEAHHKLLQELRDEDMHNVTTFLETLK